MTRQRPDRHDLVVLLTVVTAIKLLIALPTTGTNDVVTFLSFGEVVSRSGLGEAYRTLPEFNHVPLTSYYVALASHLGSFPFWLRLPGILADVGTALALFRVQALTGRPASWTLALFIVSPVGLLVAGFHGNVDPVMVMAMTWAAVAALEDRPVASAVWLALAANIKVAALLIAPVLLLWWWARGRGPRFGIVFGCLVVLGWLPGVVAAPEPFVRNVLGYGNTWGSWGISYLLATFGGATFRRIDEFGAYTPAADRVSTALKAAMVVAAGAIAWVGRRAAGADLFTVLALTWAVFFVLAVGIGPQYLVWIAPFLVVSAPRVYAAVTAGSFVYMLAFYGTTSEWRFDYAHSRFEMMDEWLPWTIVPWLVLGLAAAVLTRSLVRDRAERPTTSA